MRVVLWLVAAVAVLWTGYWFVASRSVEQGVAGWVAALITNPTTASAKYCQ